MVKNRTRTERGIDAEQNHASQIVALLLDWCSPLRVIRFSQPDMEMSTALALVEEPDVLLGLALTDDRHIRLGYGLL